MIYLDNNSTTQPDAEILQTAVEIVSQAYYNPSSWYADLEKSILEEARSKVIRATGLDPEKYNLVFTSGGTEANGLAINCSAELGEICIGTTVEHSSVYKSCVDKVPVDELGYLDLNALEDCFKRWKKWHGKKVFAMMAVNNETGVILDPVVQVPALARQYGYQLHIDAVQLFRKAGMDADLAHINADTIAISGHKVHSVKGIGALLVKKEASINKLFAGGPHEAGYRPGTENILGAYHFGEVVAKPFDLDRRVEIGRLRNEFENQLISITETNGSIEDRVDNTTSLYFPSIEDSEILLADLLERKVIASAKSACSSGMPEPSRVLQAMYGADSDRASKSIRFSLSENTTAAEINEAAEIIISLVKGV